MKPPHGHPHNSLICCPDDDDVAFPKDKEQVDLEDVFDDRLLSGADNKNKKRISQTKCEEYTSGVEVLSEVVPPEPDAEKRKALKPSCFGGDPVDLEFHIVGGTEAAVAQFPFMVAVGWPTGETPEHKWMCGGALISERYVLTAAHCTFARRTDITNTLPTVVRLGDHNLRDEVEDFAEPETVTIEKIIKHPLYNATKKYNDLALLKLEKDVTFNHFIRPICLWTEQIKDYEALSVIAAGWGTLNPGDTEMSDVLMNVPITIFNNTFCLPNFPFSRLWSGFDDAQICGGSTAGDLDTCQGDSGGPLIYRDTTKYENRCHLYVVAVTSFGNECGAANGSGVYNKVFNDIEWLENEVWPQ